MNKKKVQTNGNDKRDAATEAASGTTAVVDAGKTSPVADDTAPQDNPPGTSVSAVIDDTGNGSVSDGETGSEVSAPDASAGNGSGVDAAEHKSGNLPEHGSADEPADATPAANGEEPSAIGNVGLEDAAATATDGDIGGRDTPSGNDGGEGAEDLAGAQSASAELHGGSDVLRHDGDQTALNSAVAGVSDDLKAALELAGCETAEQLIDMALVGSSLMERTANIIKLDGEFKDWSPMDDPAELVDDLFQALEHAKEKAGNTEQPNVPNWAPDADPREIAHSFAYDVFRGVHGSVDIARVVINGGTPVEAPAVSFEAVSDLVELVRKIGSRATPEVLAQQLVIGKHRQSAALTKAEEIALKAFASVLIDLDEYAASERARIEAEAAEKPKPQTVPIDETNGELTDGPMDTWR